MFRVALTRLAAAAILFFSLGAFRALGADAKPKAYALLISGESGEPQFAENYADWVTRLHKILAKQGGLPAENICVLMENKQAAPQICSDTSRKENVLRSLKQLKEKVVPGDQVLIVLIGHATLQDKIQKFCLPGPDITVDEFTEAVNQIQTREIIVVAAHQFSCNLLERLSVPGRVLITATSEPVEGNETYFMEFFVQAYEKQPAARKDQPNLLEIFNSAALDCAKWYLRQYMIYDGHNHPTHIWRVEGKQAFALWKKFYGKLPYFEINESASSTTVDDAEPAVGDWGPQWFGRRILAEHAQLDDLGDKTGASVFVDNEFTPLKGENDAGKLAKQTCLGQPNGNRELPKLPAKAPPVKEAEKK